MSSDLFRWGILSTAKIGRQQVLPALARSKSGCIQAIASRDAARAKAQADRFGAQQAYGNYNDLLADPDVDGVYIPLPTSQHTDWTLKAAEAGKHVLCEKPIGMVATDIDRLIAARDDTGLVISEAFMVWYHPQWHKVRDLISAGAIGRLRHVSGAFSYHLMDPENMRNQPELGGGALPDIGVYPVVSTLMTTGARMSRVTAQVEYSADFGTDIFARANVEFESFNLSFHVSSQMAQHQSMRFFGETGWIDVLAPFNVIEYGDAQVVLNDQTHDTQQVFRFGKANQYEAQADAFVRACRGERDAVFPLELSRQVQEVIDAIYAAGGSRAGG